METRTLEITVTSAKGIKQCSKTNIFVAVKLHGDPKVSNHNEQRTNVIKDSSTTPKLTNSIIKFSIDEALAQANRLLITFKIKSERDKSQGDQDIGEVHVPVKELLDHLGNDKTGQRYVTYKVNNKGKPIGDISFTYSLTGPVTPSSGNNRPRYLANDHPRPAASLTRPILNQLLPSVGSFSYDHVPSPPPVLYPPALYPPILTQPEILPPVCFPGLYPPQGYPITGYIPESPPQAVYPNPMVGPSMNPGSSFCPPEGYPTVASPEMQPGLYPPMSHYRF